MFGFKPTVPDIQTERGVIDWFIECDEKIKDLKEVFSLGEMKEFKRFVLNDVLLNNSAEKLDALLKLFRKQYQEILPRAALLEEKINSLTGEGKIAAMNVIKAESFLAGKMRILGYFLLKKYGKNPST